MSGILLDTNALLWVLADSPQLGPTARGRLATSMAVRFSAVSVLEITIKEMLGRLETLGSVTEAAKQAGLLELPFGAHHASGLHAFPSLARHDPFDRMLLSQARCDDLVLLTSDRHLLGLGFTWLADARE